MSCEIHEWVVYSTALSEGCLMLQCVGCGLHASVADPNEEEWARAFLAPSQPYRWVDEDRVVVDSEMPADPYVQRKPANAKKCDCYVRLGLPEPREYERVWIEATRPRPLVTDEAQQELLGLAAMADEADDLCSTFFRLFVESYQQATGEESSHAVRWIASQLDKFPVHCSSSAVARLLREIAKR